MDNIPKWYDHYTVEKNRTILTETQLGIPGLRMFGHHISYNATESLSWHYHENAFEFSFPSKGTFSFSTVEKNYPFSGGEIFISRPNEVHGTNETPITVGELYWFQLDTSRDKDFLFLNTQAAQDLIGKLNHLSHHVVKTDAKKMLPLLEKAFSLAPHMENKYFTASLLQMFLHLVLFYSQKEPISLSGDIQAALNFVQKHITAALTLEELACIAGLSCSQFKQKFKKQLGIAPRHYINQKKIEYAKKLLAEGKSVTETAMILNFTTSNYFSSVFKKYTRYTPTEYLYSRKRKSNASGNCSSGCEYRGLQ